MAIKSSEEPSMTRIEQGSKYTGKTAEQIRGALIGKANQIISQPKEYTFLGKNIDPEDQKQMLIAKGNEVIRNTHEPRADQLLYLTSQIVRDNLNINDEEYRNLLEVASETKAFEIQQEAGSLWAELAHLRREFAQLFGQSDVYSFDDVKEMLSQRDSIVAIAEELGTPIEWLRPAFELILQLPPEEVRTAALADSDDIEAFFEAAIQKRGLTPEKFKIPVLLRVLLLVMAAFAVVGCIGQDKTEAPPTVQTEGGEGETVPTGVWEVSSSGLEVENGDGDQDVIQGYVYQDSEGNPRQGFRIFLALSNGTSRLIDLRDFNEDGTLTVGYQPNSSNATESDNSADVVYVPATVEKTVIDDDLTRYRILINENGATRTLVEMMEDIKREEASATSSLTLTVVLGQTSAFVHYRDIADAPAQTKDLYIAAKTAGNVPSTAQETAVAATPPAVDSEVIEPEGEQQPESIPNMTEVAENLEAKNSVTASDWEYIGQAPDWNLVVDTGLENIPNARFAATSPDGTRRFVVVDTVNPPGYAVVHQEFVDGEWVDVNGVEDSSDSEPGLVVFPSAEDAFDNTIRINPELADDFHQKNLQALYQLNASANADYLEALGITDFDSFLTYLGENFQNPLPPGLAMLGKWPQHGQIAGIVETTQETYFDNTVLQVFSAEEYSARRYDQNSPNYIPNSYPITTDTGNTIMFGSRELLGPDGKNRISYFMASLKDGELLIDFGSPSDLDQRDLIGMQNTMNYIYFLINKLATIYSPNDNSPAANTVHNSIQEFIDDINSGYISLSQAETIDPDSLLFTQVQ